MKRIVHLGLGNFHRAHQAWYTHIANRANGDGWAITGVAMRSPRLRDEMAASGWAYDLGILGSDGLRVERIAVHDSVLLAAEEPDRVLEALCDPEVAAVTVTVTEKGYHLRADGTLDTDNAEIASGLASGTPRTAVGLIARALLDRHESGAPPLTVLSCDNLSRNGTKLRGAVADYIAAARAPSSAIGAASFPDTMVDRITPATTDETAARMAKAAGRPVTAPVMTEAFTEWVIEDAAAGPLPDWARAGARLVPDVAPYERRKLLLLNAAHSALAYGGLLRGHGFVHEAVADRTLAAHMRALWSEAAPLLPEFGADELNDYRAALVSRFAVDGMAHRLAQIATDGSAKLPERVLPVLRHHRFDSPAAARVVGWWWTLMERREAAGEGLDDPAEPELRAAIRSGGSPAERFEAGLSSLGLSPDDLPDGWAARVLSAGRS